MTIKSHKCFFYWITILYISGSAHTKMSYLQKYGNKPDFQFSSTVFCNFAEVIDGFLYSFGWNWNEMKINFNLFFHTAPFKNRFLPILRNCSLSLPITDHASSIHRHLQSSFFYRIVILNISYSLHTEIFFFRNLEIMQFCRSAWCYALSTKLKLKWKYKWNS